MTITRHKRFFPQRASVAKNALGRGGLATVTLALMLPGAAAQSTLSYSTYFGGAGDESGSSVAIAANGDRVFCGSAESAGLSTPGALQAAPAGAGDVIVGRYAPDGQSLVFLTYFGGTGDETCTRVALDSSGDIVFVGRTASADFPTLNAADDTYAGGGIAVGSFEGDAFIAKIAGDGGEVIFSTYLGGVDLDFTDPMPLAGRETVRGLFIDDSDQIFVAGDTGAPDFPATLVLGDGECGLDTFPAVNSPFISDQFVARYQSDGTLDFVTCISGDARDTGRDVTVDDQGVIYVVGHTRSTNYPTTEPQIGPGNSFNGVFDGTVTALSADGSQILRSVSIGGSNTDFLQNIEINSAGLLVVQGASDGPDFPTTAGAWQTVSGQVSTDPGAAQDVVVFGLSAQLDELVFSTYVGGEGTEGGFSLVLDNDQPVLHLSTQSRGLPTIDPIQSDKSGDINAFATLDAVGGSAFAWLRILNTPEFFEGFVAAGPGPNRIYERDSADDTFTLAQELSEGTFDSRDVLVFDVNFDGTPDIIIGNYAGPNFLYLADATGQYGTPIPFGDPMAQTTALGVFPSATGVCVIDFVENAVNVQYVFDAVFDTFGAGLPYGAVATASRDTLGTDVGLFEISAPDEVTLYTDCALPGISPVVETVEFPGRDLVDIDMGELNDFAAGVDLGFADRNGGGLVSFDVGSLALGEETLAFPGPPTNAIAIAEDLGVVTAHDNSYRYYRLITPGELLLDTEVPASTAATALLAPTDSFSEAIIAGTPSSIDRANLVEDAEDLYFLRLSADVSDANFATYLGGPGVEFSNFGAALVEPGRIVFSGSSFSSGFPVTNGALQATTGGQQDAVFVEFDLGDEATDTDADGVADAADNCTLIANADQRDTNGDGFGNVCDPDLNNDNVVNAVDLGLLRVAFFGSPGSANWNPDADFNGDDVVNVSDLGVLRTFFFDPPGPAGEL